MSVNPKSDGSRTNPNNKANSRQQEISTGQDSASNIQNNRVTPTSSKAPAKSHKVEGKNKKSLHQKQQQQRQESLTQQQRSKNQTSQQQHESTFKQNQQNESRSAGQNSPGVSSKSSSSSSNVSLDGGAGKPCTTLDEFSKRAQDLKADINASLEKQVAHHSTDPPPEVLKLRDDIFKLSGVAINGCTPEGDQTDAAKQDDAQPSIVTSESSESAEKGETSSQVDGTNDAHGTTGTESSQVDQVSAKTDLEQTSACLITAKGTKAEPRSTSAYKSDEILTKALDRISLGTEDGSLHAQVSARPKQQSKTASKKQKAQSQANEEDNDKNQANNSKTNTKSSSTTAIKNENKSGDVIMDEFETLNTKLDADSKFVALVSSLKDHFVDAPHLLEPICWKLVRMSEHNGQLAMECEQHKNENQKLSIVKQKLENLCRELQKSNNSIRIESLDLIKVEQSKAKEQTTKIQSTLSGVIKLFDENQQRNMLLRQENQELQTKLKSLLDHCDSWEKSVEAALRQRDIENRLLKTELAKANLLKSEEKEKFLGEKQELLQLLSMMQEQQHRIEGQEAKLRSDLSSYASKYDECQAVISKGMSRFQTESKRMLKQIEKSKQDYKVLLTKYELSNRRMAQLLEEKQRWDKALSLANRKIETLERLCRALREQKAADDDVAVEKRALKNSNNGSGKQSAHELKQKDIKSDSLAVGGDRTKESGAGQGADNATSINFREPNVDVGASASITDVNELDCIQVEAVMPNTSTPDSEHPNESGLITEAIVSEPTS